MDDLRDWIRPLLAWLPAPESGARQLLSQLPSKSESLGARDWADPDRVVGAAICPGQYCMVGQSFARHRPAF
jgi:hypothetical protein